jgi:hypothetical protein
MDGVVGFVVNAAKSAGKLFMGSRAGGPDSRSADEKAAAVDAAIGEVAKATTAGHLAAPDVAGRLPAIQAKYRLTSLSVEGQTVKAVLNPVRVWAIPPPGTTAGTGGVEAVSQHVTPAGIRTVTIRGEILDRLPRLIAPNFNQNMPALGTLPAAVQTYVQGYRWAHLWGPGFGDEAIQGLMLASFQVNNRLQSRGPMRGVEQAIARLGRYVRAAGGHVYLEAEAVSYSDPPPGVPGPIGVPLLRKVDYQILVQEASGQLVKGSATIRCEPPLPGGAGGMGEASLDGMLVFVERYLGVK